jgi:hypothetical protein
MSAPSIDIERFGLHLDPDGAVVVAGDHYWCADCGKFTVVCPEGRRCEPCDRAELQRTKQLMLDKLAILRGGHEAFWLGVHAKREAAA